MDNYSYECYLCVRLPGDHVKCVIFITEYRNSGKVFVVVYFFPELLSPLSNVTGLIIGERDLVLDLSGFKSYNILSIL